MQKERKKSFSLSLLVRIFLVIMVVVSIAVFINSVMLYNEKRAEIEEKQQIKQELTEEKEALTELVESERDKNFIVRMARRFWGLFFPDEEIYYNNQGS